MIIFTGSNDAVSFTDEGSPDTRITGDKVCINGQVNRDLSLDWYYKIIQFFPDVQGELKSKEVEERFRNFPATTQSVIWAGLGRVKIHIVDPGPTATVSTTYYGERGRMIRHRDCSPKGRGRGVLTPNTSLLNYATWWQIPSCKIRLLREFSFSGGCS